MALTPPVVLRKVLSGQGMHIPRSLPKRPRGHMRQSVGAVEPAPSVVEPRGQVMQGVTPSVLAMEYFPSAHLVQVPLPSSTLPRAQHTVDPGGLLSVTHFLQGHPSGSREVHE